MPRWHDLRSTTGVGDCEGVSLLPGGVPIVVDGIAVGAVGVAGSADGKDHLIAEAGVAALRADATV